MADGRHGSAVDNPLARHRGASMLIVVGIVIGVAVGAVEG